MYYKNHCSLYIKSCPFVCRGETSQVRRVRQGVQPVVEPDHPQPEAHRLQAVYLRTLRKKFSGKVRTPHFTLPGSSLWLLAEEPER